MENISNNIEKLGFDKWFQNNADKVTNLKENNFVEGGTEIYYSWNCEDGHDGVGEQ